MERLRVQYRPCQICERARQAAKNPPDPLAAREFLDRTEGKVTEKHQIEHFEKDLSDEELDMQIETLLSENNGLQNTVLTMIGDNQSK